MNKKKDMKDDIDFKDKLIFDDDDNKNETQTIALNDKSTSITCMEEVLGP